MCVGLYRKWLSCFSDIVVRKENVKCLSYFGNKVVNKISAGLKKYHQFILIKQANIKNS